MTRFKFLRTFKFEVAHRAAETKYGGIEPVSLKKNDCVIRLALGWKHWQETFPADTSHHKKGPLTPGDLAFELIVKTIREQPQTVSQSPLSRLIFHRTLFSHTMRNGTQPIWLFWRSPH